jgi:nucleotide-binding universal stress UspA family protein
MTCRIEPGSIVLAVDGSKHAERATHWAADQAFLEGRRLVVMSAASTGRILEPAHPIPRTHLDPVEDGVEDAGAIVEGGVALATRLHPGLTVQALPAIGDPRQILIDLSSQARLIVTGSHGRGTFRSMLLGSVSAAVSKYATCPVMVCRPSSGAAGGGVVVGADGTPQSVPVIQFAFEQASRRGWQLTVLHSFWDVVAAVAHYKGMSEDDLIPGELQQLHMVLSESVAGLREMYPDVAVSLQLRHGLVDEALSPRGASWDLVVVGRHPVGSLDSWLHGSIAIAVLERSHATVAVVPQAGGADRR